MVPRYSEREWVRERIECSVEGRGGARVFWMQVLRGCYIIDRGSWAINSKYDRNRLLFFIWIIKSSSQFCNILLHGYLTHQKKNLSIHSDFNFDEYALCRRMCQLFMIVGVLSRHGGVCTIPCFFSFFFFYLKYIADLSFLDALSHAVSVKFRASQQWTGPQT